MPKSQDFTENSQEEAVSETSSATSPSSTAASSTRSALRVGIDLGTNTSVVLASRDGDSLPLEQDMVRTVVGFPKAGIIPGILPSDNETVFGDEAIQFRLHLDLKWPLHEGFVQDVEVCRLFTQRLRQLIDSAGSEKLWGVVGAPANTSAQRQKEIRSAMVGVLDRILIVPEPFLAAMGLREDPGFQKSAGEADPTKHSLIVDIGAGTTDLCLVRGYFPTSEDQISFPKAGNFVDEKLVSTIGRRYPDVNLTRVTITQLKEGNSFVSGSGSKAVVKVYVDGRPQSLDFTEIMQEACDSLVDPIVKGIKELFKRCDSDSIVNVMQNIIVTGGGSEIQGLAERVQETLHAEGYDCARTLKPSDYKRLVAHGALRIAENVREDQWQVPM
jgi:rod shape-determining protein MreB